MLELLITALFLFATYIAGSLTLRWITKSNNIQGLGGLAWAICSFILGFVFFSLCAYGLGFLRVPLKDSALVFLFFSLAAWPHSISNLHVKIRKPTRYLVVLLFTGIVSLSFFSFFQSSNLHRGLRFHSANFHDGMWHIALQQMILQRIPPQNPIYAGDMLQGYHYLVDLYWAAVASVGGLDLFTLYLLVAPVLYAMLLVSTTFVLFSTLSNKKHVVFLTSLLAVAGSGFSYLAPIFFQIKKVDQSIFWLDQPVRYAINPQFLFSLSVINVLMLLVTRSAKKFMLPIGVLLGSLVVIKVYAFVIIFPAFALLALYRFFKEKDRSLLLSCLIGLAIGLVCLALSGTGTGFPFLLSPGWFVRTMFEGGDKLGYDTWEIHRQLFVQNNNLLRLTIHWGLGFILFFVGNFGIKILGLFAALVLLLRKQISSLHAILLISPILFAFVIPSLVIQRGIVWNSIQFLHYAQIPLCALLLLGLDRITSKRRAMVLGSALLVFALPATLYSLAGDLRSSAYTTVPPEIIKEIQELKHLDAATPLKVGGFFRESSVVPAFTGVPVDATDTINLDILGYSTERLATMDRQITGREVCPTGQYVLHIGGISTLSGVIVREVPGFVLSKCDSALWKPELAPPPDPTIRAY